MFKLNMLQTMQRVKFTGTMTKWPVQQTYTEQQETHTTRRNKHLTLNVFFILKYLFINTWFLFVIHALQK